MEAADSGYEVVFTEEATMEVVLMMVLSRSCCGCGWGCVTCHIFYSPCNVLIEIENL